MTFHSVSMEETEMNQDVNECMICHCGPEDDEGKSQTLGSVKAVRSLVKECNCDYLVHEACLVEWLSTTPMCPICKICTYYAAPRRKKDTALTPDQQPFSVTRCLHRFLCCVASPGAVRNAPAE